MCLLSTRIGMFVPKISDRLREAREALGLSQQAMAERCGIVVRSQRNYESGERSPDATYLAALAAIGADVTYILTGQRVSEWERDVLARTAKTISETESDPAGKLHQSLARAFVAPGVQKAARRPKFQELEMACVSCTDDDFVFVMDAALALARRLATGRTAEPSTPISKKPARKAV